MRNIRFVYVFAIFQLLFGFKGAELNQNPIAQRNNDQTIRIIEEHPRILITDTALSVIKEQAKTDLLLQRYISQVIQEANRHSYQTSIKYFKSKGYSMFQTSQECLNRLLYIGFAYRLTEENRYAEAAKKILLDACSFTDWNPDHFIDVSEMTNAVGIGYDWIYKSLDSASRATIERAILEKGLKPYLLADINRKWITRTAFNFNPVSNGSAIIGALSVADRYPREAQNVLQTAIKNLPIALKSYSPDGLWPEGEGYWHYATNYMIYGIKALQVATGTDFGLSNEKGFSVTGNFIPYIIGPSGYSLHFGDTKINERYDRPKFSLFWLGKRFKNQSLINLEHQFIAQSIAHPLHIIDYSPPVETLEAPQLDKLFAGKVPISTFRSSWKDTDALFVGSKGGDNTTNHCHLDLGNFELEYLGVRWVSDLGWDNYNLKGYWDSREGGQRWQYYRCNSHSHNVPMINNKDQLVNGIAIVKSHAENINEPYITYDLTSAYKDDAHSVIREIKITEQRKAVQITDIFNLKKQSDIYWGITTPAVIKILDEGSTALLNSGGKKLYAKIVHPVGLTFYSESCFQREPQANNFGFSRLMVKLNHAEGIVKLKITFTLNP